MLTVPRIRVGSRSAAYFSEYTLGGSERFRLDTASWTQHVASDLDTFLPTLTVSDPNGEVIAECTTPGAGSPTFPAPFGLTITGPAAFTDAFALLPPNVFTGYVVNDFGAVPITSNMQIAWNQPPGAGAAGGAVWLRSAGAVVCSGNVALDTTFESQSVTLHMTAGAAAGTYLLIVVNAITPTDFLTSLPWASITATSTVAGNVIDPDFLTTTTGVSASTRAADGWFSSVLPLFYRVTNPLVAGDTVTLTFTGGEIWRLDISANVLTGLTVGNPYGPSAGAQYTSEMTGSAASPLLIHGTVPGGTPRWVRGALVFATYTINPQAFADVMLERGSVEHLGPAALTASTTHAYFQATLPDLVLEPGCTLRAAAVNSAGDIRVTDLVSDFLIWARDE